MLTTKAPLHSEIDWNVTLQLTAQRQHIVALQYLPRSLLFVNEKPQDVPVEKSKKHRLLLLEVLRITSNLSFRY